MDRYGSFAWGPEKEEANIQKHGVDFITAARAFKDPKRKIFVDSEHSALEPRFFCVGKTGKKVVTVRFTYRFGRIRIYGAGYWRKGRKYYEKEES